jgi:hypothetical protein
MVVLMMANADPNRAYRSAGAARPPAWNSPSGFGPVLPRFGVDQDLENPPGVG